MKTIKAKSLDELREKVIATDWYKKRVQDRYIIKEKIAKFIQEEGYNSRDLEEELLCIEQALNINYASKDIIKGYFKNQPYVGSFGGHSRLTNVKLYEDAKRQRFKCSFFIFDLQEYN